VKDAKTLSDPVFPNAIGVDASATQRESELAKDRANAKSSTSVAKRGIDLAISTVLFVASLPILTIIAIAVRLESAGPVIFKQRRTGHQGRIFAIYKFRTMTIAEDSGDVQRATRGDARVTAVGGLLRKLGLDGLPQVINVLKGDMSIVGPRPHALAHDDYYGETIPGYVDRFRAKPGLTGLAQVNGLRGEIQDRRSMRDRIAADNLYIDAWSIGLDLAIIIKTIGLLIFARGRETEYRVRSADSQASKSRVQPAPNTDAVRVPPFSGRGAVSAIRGGMMGAVSAALAGAFMWPDAPLALAGLTPAIAAAICAIVGYVGAKRSI